MRLSCFQSFVVRYSRCFLESTPKKYRNWRWLFEVERLLPVGRPSSSQTRRRITFPPATQRAPHRATSAQPRGSTLISCRAANNVDLTTWQPRPEPPSIFLHLPSSSFISLHLTSCLLDTLIHGFMADETLFAKVQGLSDLELATLLCLVHQEHCIIDTDPGAEDDLVHELRLVSSLLQSFNVYLTFL